MSARLSVHGIISGRNSGVGCHFLLQWIFLTQGLDPHLLRCGWILYHGASWEVPQNPFNGQLKYLTVRHK